MDGKSQGREDDNRKGLSRPAVGKGIQPSLIQWENKRMEAEKFIRLILLCQEEKERKRWEQKRQAWCG
jgi:hypothetical protein